MAIAIGLLKMLLELQQTRKSGALDVVGPRAHVRLFIEDGSVVFADEGTVGETLGRILVRERVLTPEQYATAIETISDLRAAGKQAKLGEVFVELGMLTREQVVAALSAQVQQKVMRALAWPSASFRFTESHGPLAIADRFVTVIEPLVIAAMRLADRERLEVLLAQARPRYAALRGDAGPGGGSTKLESIARLNAFRLPAAEDAFARSLDGSHTVDELLAVVDAPDAPRVDRGVVLAALLVTDALDLPSAVNPDSVRGGRHLARPIGPPRAAPRAAKPKANASAMIAAIGATPPQAAAAAGNAPVAEPADTTMAPLLAEKAFQAGRALVRAHRMAEAGVELKLAASLYDAVEYELWAAWAAARGDARGEDAHVDALRAAAERAIEQDTERAFATFVLGHLAKLRGDEVRAAELIARARAIEPEIAAIAGEAEANANANANANAEESAVAKGGKEEEASGGDGERIVADARLGEELEVRARAARDVTVHARRGAVPARVAAVESARIAPRRGWMAAVAVAVVVAGVIWVATRDTTHADAPVITAASGTAVASASASTARTAQGTGQTQATSEAPESTASAAPLATGTAEARDASYADVEAGLPSVDATRGVLVLPSTADGHRVYVDGRLAGIPPPPIVVACGRHIVKIGSQGREQVVQIPCGGRIPLAYP